MRQAFLIAAIVLVAVSITLAEVPQLISYQGRLMDGGKPVNDSTYSVKFTIYDNLGGTALWTQTQNVTTSGGVFSVLLGSVTPITTAVLAGPVRYLGIKVGSNAEMWPPSQLVSTPYALIADSTRTVGDLYVKLDGDTITGPLAYQRTSEGVDAKLSATTSGGKLELMDAGESRVELGAGVGGGGLYITDPGGQDEVQLFGNGSGGQLRLYNSSGGLRVLLDGSGSGSVQLPSGSINSGEISDEPGIDFDTTSSTVVLTTSMTDIVTVSITIPTHGNIYVTARGTAYLSGTSGTNYGYAQIDEYEGGSVLAAAYRTVFGAENFVTNQSSFWPFALTRVFVKASPGTYTFRLEGRCGGAQGSGASIDVRGASIEAIFVPTRY